MEVTEKIIILKTKKIKESDLLVFGLNERGIAQTYIARYALKSKKRFFGGVLEPTHYVEVTYRATENKRSRGGIYNIKEACLLSRFSGIRDDYERVLLALHFLDIVYRVSFDSSWESEELFNLLGNALDLVKDSQNLPALKTLFELKFLNQQGVLPRELKHPSFLGKKLLDHEKIKFHDKKLDQKIESVLKEYVFG